MATFRLDPIIQCIRFICQFNISWFVCHTNFIIIYLSQYYLNLKKLYIYIIIIIIISPEQSTAKPSSNVFHRCLSNAVLSQVAHAVLTMSSRHIVSCLPLFSCAIPWIPWCYHICPSIVLHSCNMARPSLFHYSYFFHHIHYFCLFSYPFVTFSVSSGYA